jgi:hypothetical protein
MSTSTSEYLLLFRGSDWQNDVSPQELEETMGRFIGWFEELQSQGKLKGANPLMTEGRIVSGTNGRHVTDGPFAESKETIGGYFLLTVADMEEAVEIARKCPLLDHGSQVEVRPVAQECAMITAVREAQAELAHA